MAVSELSNILIDPLPTTVMIVGEDVPIAFDFRTGILFESMMQDGSLSRDEKSICTMQLWYPQGLPDDQERTILEATDQLIWFYHCGKLPGHPQRGNQQEEKGNAKGLSRRVYDFDVDAPLIYAAFLTQYHVDLQDVENLHWWKFCAMFEGLHEEHQISKIMGYRSIELSAIKSRPERERYAKLQAKYALPDNRSPEEKQRMVGALFGGGMMR